MLENDTNYFRSETPVSVSSVPGTRWLAELAPDEFELNLFQEEEMQSTAMEQGQEQEMEITQETTASDPDAIAVEDSGITDTGDMSEGGSVSEGSIGGDSGGGDTGGGDGGGGDGGGGGD